MTELKTGLQGMECIGAMYVMEEALRNFVRLDNKAWRTWSTLGCTALRGQGVVGETARLRKPQAIQYVRPQHLSLPTSCKASRFGALPYHRHCKSPDEVQPQCVLMDKLACHLAPTWIWRGDLRKRPTGTAIA